MMRVWIAVWTGSSRICTAIAGWLIGGGSGATFGKLALVLFAAGFAKGLPWTTNIALLLAAAWLVTAVAIGLRLPDPTKPSEAQPAKDAGEAQPQHAAAPYGITREQLVRALHEVGAPHAHTTALADHLKASTDAVREALAEAGIPTQGGVRMKGRRVAVSPGVKREDFPPLPSPADEAAMEGTLTSNNNDNNNTEVFETVPDKERPHRTLVRWRKASK
jgi:hypothetical protein